MWPAKRTNFALAFSDNFMHSVGMGNKDAPKREAKKPKKKKSA
jgi:hypothetical protein